MGRETTAASESKRAYTIRCGWHGLSGQRRYERPAAYEWPTSQLFSTPTKFFNAASQLQSASSEFLAAAAKLQSTPSELLSASAPDAGRCRLQFSRCWLQFSHGWRTSSNGRRTEWWHAGWRTASTRRRRCTAAIRWNAAILSVKGKYYIVCALCGRGAEIVIHVCMLH